MEARAERLVREGLKELGWTEKVLKMRRKGGPGKVKLARRLRSRTTIPLAWVAQRLGTGRRGYLAWLVRRRESGPSPSAPKRALPQI